MANWKFTDQYEEQFPALGASVLSNLVFSDHSVDGNKFTGTLDLKETGPMLSLTSEIFGLQQISFTGTIDITSTQFTLNLQSAELPAFKALPVIGDHIKSTTILIQTSTTPAEDIPDQDEFRMEMDVQFNDQISGKFITDVPRAYGSFLINAYFENLGIGLNDLDFLLPEGSKFATYFPSDNPFVKSVTGGSTQLSLLGIDLTLFISNKRSLKVSVSSLGVSVGIVNIPVYKNALFLNPLSVSVYFYDLPSLSDTLWSISGTLALYPPAAQTLPPVPPADFEFAVGMTLPVAGQSFSISGKFDNPNQLPVSAMLVDMFGKETTIGAEADNIIISEFDFGASAASEGGGIGSFYVDITLDSQFGIFQSQHFDVKEFKLSVNYQKS